MFTSDASATSERTSLLSVIDHEELPPSSPEERVCASDSSATSDPTSELSITEGRFKVPPPLELRAVQEETALSTSAEEIERRSETSGLFDTVSDESLRTLPIEGSIKVPLPPELRTGSQQKRISEESASTASQSSSELSPFYRKTYARGYGFIGYFKKKHYININGDAGDKERILEQVAEAVVWNVPCLREKNLLLSVTGGEDVFDYDGRKSFKHGFEKILPGTCIVTGGTEDGITKLVGEVVYTFNINTRHKDIYGYGHCPTIGIVSWDHIKHNYVLKSVELIREVFGIDSDGHLFTLDKKGQRWTLNPAALTEVSFKNDHSLTQNFVTGDVESNSSSRRFTVGDIVRIGEDLDHVKSKMGTLWNNSVEHMLGHIGTILKNDSDSSNLRIIVRGTVRDFVPEAVTLVKRERFIDLVNKHFKANPPLDKTDKFVQAVNNNEVEEVDAILNEAYMDFRANDESIFERDSQPGRTLGKKHDLFVFVEDSTLNLFGGANTFRAKLEDRISSKMYGLRVKDETKKVPTVNLVLNNDLDTLKTVTRAIYTNRPSVVVKGSNGVEDLIAYAVENESDFNKRQSADIKTGEFLKSKLENSEIQKEYTTFQQSLQKRPNMVSVIDLCNIDKLEEMMLTMCWKVRLNLTCLLKWALIKHDREVFLKRLLCTDGRTMASADLEITMWYFFIRHDCDVVKKLVQHDVYMDSVLIGASQYMELCGKVDEEGLLKSLQQKLGDTSRNKDIRTIMGVIRRIRERPIQRQGTVDGNRHWQRPVEEVMKLWCKSCLNGSSEKVGGQWPLPYWNYFFVWALLWRKHNLAELLLQRVEHPLAMALIAYSLFNAVEKQTDDKILKMEMKKFMKTWSEKALNLLNECSQEDDQYTQQLLTLELPWWKMTCLELAIESDFMEFLNQQPCRNLFATVWNGKLKSDNILKYSLCLICPVLSPKLLHYTHDISTNLEKIREFFLAPKTKFAYNLIAYLVFLCLFTYVLLFDLYQTVSTTGYGLMAWVLTISVEEIRQMVMTKKKIMYLSDGWNIIDVCAIVLFLIGFGLRFKHFPDTIDLPRVVLAVDFIAFFFRLIHIFSVQDVLGPKLIMIQKMFQDLMYFLVIMAVFVLSYAISTYSILYPNSPVTLATASQIIRKPYFHLYGELFLEDTEGLTDCTTDVTLWTNGTYPRCPSDTGKIVVPIMMGLYLLIVNILLLNLLIAMFSHTFMNIQKQSDALWSFQRYSIIKEYGMRPILCPPLNVFWHMYQLVDCARCPRGMIVETFRHVQDYERANEPTTTSDESLIISITDDNIKDTLPLLQKKVRAITEKIVCYPKLNDVELKHKEAIDNSILFSLVYGAKEVKQIVNTLHATWKVISTYENSTKYRKQTNDAESVVDGLRKNCSKFMKDIQQQIRELEEKMDCPEMQRHHIPLQMLQRTALDKYNKTQKDTQSGKTDTIIKEINERLDRQTKEEHEFRKTITAQLTQGQESYDTLGKKVDAMTKEEQEFCNTITDQLKQGQESYDTLVKKVDAMTKDEQEFRITMLIKIKQAAEREDEFRLLVLAEFRKMQNNFDALNKKVDMEKKPDSEQPME